MGSNAEGNCAVGVKNPQTAQNNRLYAGVKPRKGAENEQKGQAGGLSHAGKEGRAGAPIRSCINGRLGTMENRMASLMFKLIVELDMCMSILADCTQLDEEYLRRKRAESVERARRTNGQTRFEQIARRIEDD